MVNKNYKFDPDYAVPPGNTLLETLDYLNISQAEFAKRTGRPVKTINEIIKGKAAITPESALQFEKVLGVAASFWINLESNYQENLARQREKQLLAEQVDWLKEIPIKEMFKYGWISQLNDKVACVQEALTFFGVASVDAWQSQCLNPQAAFRKSNAWQTNSGSLAAWLRKGEIESQEIECDKYCKTTFKEVLIKIRSLTVLPPDEFEQRLIDLCASAGVAVVFVKELPKCPVSGATRWISQNKALIQMSLRYKTDDHFWFTFFHEAGHILKHGKKEIFLEGDSNDVQKEAEADEFAAEFLIPKTELDAFKKRTSPYYSAIKINFFAKDLGIAPGIIVGRLQHESIIPYTNLNKLKRKFEWAQ